MSRTLFLLLPFPFLKLKDRKKIPAVLVEVFVEFLIHEEGFKKFEKYHAALLQKIADRACARFNGGENIDVDSSDFSKSKDIIVKPAGLHDDVFKSVEQELFRLVHADSAQNVI